MKHIVSLLVAFLVSFGGETGKITGTIYDNQSNQPIENVNVYIAKSTIGASTNSRGEFVIRAIPPGRYTLILSHLSYENKNLSVAIRENQKLEIDLLLTPKPIEFPEIDVTDLSDDEWNRQFKTFQRGLLGISWFADGCEILNPYYISFEEKENGTLLAECDVPILIENRSLGYNITYFLEHFEYRFDTTKYAGQPYFEEMSSQNAEDSLVWRENRLRAYMGSVRHFLRALSDFYTSLQDSFSIAGEQYFKNHGFIIHLNKKYSTVYGDQYVQKEFSASSVLAQSPRTNELYLICEDEIQVEYFKEYRELNYEPQVSYIKTHADSVYFDKRGRYHDGFKLQTMGYMYKQRLAEMLPFEYEPSDSLIFNTDFR